MFLWKFCVKLIVLPNPTIVKLNTNILKFCAPVEVVQWNYLVASNANPFIWFCLENNLNGGSGWVVWKKQRCSEFLHKMFWEVYAMPFHEIKRAVSRFTISCHVRTKSFFTKSWFVFVCVCHLLNGKVRLKHARKKWLDDKCLQDNQMYSNIIFHCFSSLVRLINFNATSSLLANKSSCLLNWKKAGS